MSEKRRVCECGHRGAEHHLNLVEGELTYCNVCDTCQTYEYDTQDEDQR